MAFAGPDGKPVGQPIAVHFGGATSTVIPPGAPLLSDPIRIDVNELPVSAEILEVNPLLKDQPELVNKDPYGDGWMVRIKLSNPAEVAGLMDSAAYQALAG